MAMTVQQAEDLVRSTVNPDDGPSDPDQPGGDITPPFGPTQGPSNEFDYAIIPPDFQPLNPWRPGYFYNQRTHEVGRIKQTSGGNTTFETLSVAEAKTFLADLSTQLGGAPSDTSGSGGGGGSSGGIVTPAEQAQLDYNYAQLRAQQEQDAITNALNQQQAGQGYVQSRATTGLNLADLQRGLANDVYQRALDPGNYPAYLAASAGLPQGAGSPISALIGQGAQIQPPGGSNPLADPRFQNLMSNLYEYAQPGALQTVQGIAAQHGGTLPPEFYAYTHTQPPKYATGGEQVVNSPVIGVDAYTGQPKFIAGEAGEEKITFQPTHHHETAGMPTPHVHHGGESKHEHQGQVIQYADGGVAYAGSPTVHQLQAAWNAYHPNDQHPDNVYTPAEGTAISLGKALQPLGYVPQYLIQQLSEGRTPTPGSVDESLLQRLPPSLRALLQAQIRSALGGAGVMDYNQELQNQQFSGLNSGRTYNSYQ